MNSRLVVPSLVLSALIGALLGGAVLTSAQVPPANPDIVAAPSENVFQEIPIQGKLTDSNGVPLNGHFNITFALYDVPSGGVALCFDSDDVDVTNGLFSAYVSFCTAEDIDGRQLYLGIQVGSDPEMVPREYILPVPYAYSLVPGAIIRNTGTGHGLEVKSAAPGENGSALRAENGDASGIALWAKAVGSDTTVAIENTGTGALIKAFGGDGGEDEFYVGNDGTIQTKADSYLFVPGAAFVKNRDNDATRWDIQIGGAARISSGDAYPLVLYYPISIPAVLYGQGVKVESITVYYRVSNAANAYIVGTFLDAMTGADSSLRLIGDTTQRKSTVATNYTLTPTVDSFLSSSYGPMAVYFNLQFANTTDYVEIGGIRVRLGHHPLY